MEDELKLMFVGGFLTYQNTMNEIRSRCQTRTEYGIDIEAEIINREFAKLLKEMQTLKL